MLVAMPGTVYQISFCRTHIPGLALIHLAPCAEMRFPTGFLVLGMNRLCHFPFVCMCSNVVRVDL